MLSKFRLTCRVLSKIKHLSVPAVSKTNFRFLSQFQQRQLYHPTTFPSPSLQKLLHTLNPKMTDAKKSPEGVIINWDFNNLKKEDIQSIGNKLVKELEKAVDEIVASPTVSYETVFKPVLYLEHWFQNQSQAIVFPAQVAVDKTIRDAAFEISKLIEEATVNMQMRVDLFCKLVAYKEQCADKDGLSPEKIRALDKLIREGKRNGLSLDEKTREEVKSIKNELNKKGLEFSQNLAEDKWERLFSAEELAGMPETFLEGLEKDESNGKYKVTLQYPHLYPIIKMCKIPETRKILSTANSSKAKEVNTKLLEDMLELRDKEAHLLGYKNHAAYLQEELMAKSPDNVQKFLRDLATKLQPLWAKERQQFLALKEQECQENGWEFNGKLDPWDSTYYTQRVEETQYSIKREEYRAYFPLEHVTAGLLDIYQQLLQLKFTLLPDAPTWHSEVQAYQVSDSVDGTLLGYFYLDLHPRDGKYTHACNIPLQVSYTQEDGIRVPAVVAMLCNFSKPCGNRPALLYHDEVETYFHEFGHVMHCLCSKAETAVFSGFSGVQKDFIECPSQMLENWVWHAEPLGRMSKHFETGEHLPVAMVEKLEKSTKANAGAINLRQVVLALFDQTVHTGPRCDTAKVYEDTVREILDMDTIPNTNFAATFNHLAHGYSARYYSYLWSQVFSMDMFETIFGDKLMDPVKGLLYRKNILEPGGSIDADVLLKNTLGRDPKPDAFLRHKGIDVST